MKTNEILLVVGGVALGYFASRMNLKKRDKIQDELIIEEFVVPPMNQTVKMADCEKKLGEALITVKLPPEAMDLFKKDFLADCMAK